MFEETIEEIRDKVVGLDNIYSDAITVDAVSCSSVIHEFVEDIQKKLDELIELGNERRIVIPCKLINKLQDSREKVEELEKQIEEKDKKIEKLYHDLDDSDREINSLREDNDVLVERIEKIENDIRISISYKLINELQDSREKVEELTKHNDDLRKNHKELCECINELTQENESLKHQVDIWKKEALAQKDEKIENLNKELDKDRIFFQTRMDITCLDKNLRVCNAFMNDNKKEN